MYDLDEQYEHIVRVCCSWVVLLASHTVLLPRPMFSTGCTNKASHQSYALPTASARTSALRYRPLAHRPYEPCSTSCIRRYNDILLRTLSASSACFRSFANHCRLDNTCSTGYCSCLNLLLLESPH